MDPKAFPHHQAQQAALREVMVRIRERRAAWMAEVAIAKAAGKLSTFGWPVLVGAAK